MSEADHQYAVALSDLASGHSALRPPNRVTIAEGAAATLVIKQTGQAGTPWDASETPYMVEPMNMLASRRHDALAFVGPARTGKTASLLLGWIAHAVVNDPGDFLLIHTTKDKAREFSKTDLKRALDHSPKVNAMKSDRAVDENTHDVLFRHGMWLRIGWPTSTNLASSSYRYTASTDYDRIEGVGNIGGEGTLFDQLRTRTTTFLSRGMTLVESSPGVDMQDPNWNPSSPHEAPAVSGVVGIYNRSDRRRWYWNCPDCSDWFEAKPGLDLFCLPPDAELQEMVRTMDIPAVSSQYGSRIVCPCCGVHIPSSAKVHMNRHGRWLAEGQTIDSDGVISGSPSAEKVVGYWLGGVAAAYRSWTSLVERYLQGLRDYVLTGDEFALKTTTNVDQGMPYMSRHLVEARAAARNPADRLDDGLQRYVVPPWTRCLVAAVDVQGGINSRFVVQVHAVGPHMEQAVVNRFELRQSRRAGMGAEFAQIDPAGHPEDWDVLTEELLRKTYRTPIEGREIRIKALVVDSGGEDGVTQNAYAWFRRVRKLGLAARVRLYKGASTKTAPIVKETMVGQRNSKEKGDIPLYTCNPHLLSDAVSAGLKRDTPGPGFIHFPSWLPPAFFDELGAETRGANGLWTQIRKRNESFDLCRMIRVGMLFLGLDKVRNWNVVPPWLAPLDQNSEVIAAEVRREMQANEPVETVISVAPVRRVKKRRMAASPYL